MGWGSAGEDMCKSSLWMRPFLRGFDVQWSRVKDVQSGWTKRQVIEHLDVAGNFEVAYRLNAQDIEIVSYQVHDGRRSGVFVCVYINEKFQKWVPWIAQRPPADAKVTSSDPEVSLTNAGRWPQAVTSQEPLTTEAMDKLLLGGSDGTDVGLGVALLPFRGNARRRHENAVRVNAVILRFLSGHYVPLGQQMPGSYREILNKPRVSASNSLGIEVHARDLSDGGTAICMRGYPEQPGLIDWERHAPVIVCADKNLIITVVYGGGLARSLAW